MSNIQHMAGMMAALLRQFFQPGEALMVLSVIRSKIESER